MLHVIGWVEAESYTNTISGTYHLILERDRMVIISIQKETPKADTHIEETVQGNGKVKK